MLVATLAMEPYKPSYGKSYKPATYDEIPHCAKASGKPWCLEDAEYPVYDVQHAVFGVADEVGKDEAYEPVLVVRGVCVQRSWYPEARISCKSSESVAAPIPTRA